MDTNEAIEALELLGFDYTIHKQTECDMDKTYLCLIEPEYGMCMELMLSKGWGQGASLSSAIHAAIDQVTKGK